MGETVGASGRLRQMRVGLHWDCSSCSSSACPRLAYVSHDSAILTAAYKSGFNGMLGIALALAVAVEFGVALAVEFGVAVALDFGVDGMLRFAMLAQEVIV